MNYIFAIIAGVVQGLTEFLPISSSGHLVLLHDFLDFALSDELTFDVILHLATMCSLLIFFWKDVVKLLKSFVKSFAYRDTTDPYQSLSWFIVIGTIPAAAIGFFFEQQIEDFFRDSAMVGLMLIVFGFLLWVADEYGQKKNDVTDITLGNSIAIGIAQAIALVPGVSRSGITIIAGLSQNLKREAAARFSFLLSMPVVFGAGLKKIIDVVQAGVIRADEVSLLILGFVASLVTGYLCIKYFLLFLQKHSLKVFAYYRIALGLIVLGVLFI